MAGTVHLKVTGMTCGGCENAVSRAVKQITGVHDVSASHAGNSVDVSFDERTVTPEMIQKRIEELGYQVVP